MVWVLLACLARLGWAGPGLSPTCKCITYVHIHVHIHKHTQTYVISPHPFLLSFSHLPSLFPLYLGKLQTSWWMFWAVGLHQCSAAQHNTRLLNLIYTIHILAPRTGPSNLHTTGLPNSGYTINHTYTHAHAYSYTHIHALKSNILPFAHILSFAQSTILMSAPPDKHTRACTPHIHTGTSTHTHTLPEGNILTLYLTFFYEHTGASTASPQAEVASYVPTSAQMSIRNETVRSMPEHERGTRPRERNEIIPPSSAEIHEPGKRTPCTSAPGTPTR